MPAITEKLRLAAVGRLMPRSPSKRKIDPSLPIGVRCQRPGRFIAAASLDGKTAYFGTFDTPAEAHAAYVQRVAEHVNTAHKISEA